MMNWMSVDRAQFYDGARINGAEKSGVKQRNICQSITIEREKHNSAVNNCRQYEGGGVEKGA